MLFENNGGIAQLVEHLICIQKVAGSNPTTSTIRSHVERYFDELVQWLAHKCFGI